jgi:glutamate dehydrogenase/leucine dehydrogenase
VCAALSDVVTKDNYQDIKDGIILELANGPVEHEAHEKLYESGKIIIPDIVANAGGVIVSYYEWLQNKNNEKWDRNKIINMLDQTLSSVMSQVIEYSEKQKISYKQAAFEIAIRRLI